MDVLKMRYGLVKFARGLSSDNLGSIRTKTNTTILTPKIVKHTSRNGLCESDMKEDGSTLSRREMSPLPADTDENEVVDEGKKLESSRFGAKFRRLPIFH